jgi:hypothetical protein
MSTYTPISSQTLSANATTVTFTGIPQTYTDLIMVVSSQGTRATFGGDLTVRLNGDSGSNYSVTTITGTGSAAQSARFSNQTSLSLGGDIGPVSTSTYTPTIIHFMNYANTTTNKTVLCRHNNAGQRVVATVGLWRNTAAITQIDLTAGGYDYVSGSTFTLYGIGAGSPKAFGGDEVRTDGTYWYHIYRSSGIFAPMSNLSCDYLVVAGGGSGGVGYDPAGGGAGGYRTTVGTSGGNSSAESALNLISGTNYTVTVGAGGAGIGGSSTPTLAGNSGSNSVFATITSTGGGGGASFSSSIGTIAGKNGGSGGGGARDTNTFGTGTTGQGFNGGQGAGNRGGGGGGAGAVGGNAVSNSSIGVGGAGLASSITGTSVTRAVGGSGNDKDGGSSNASGTANTGNGGNGGSQVTSSGNGGSGIVVVRYSAV